MGIRVEIGDEVSFQFSIRGHFWLPKDEDDRRFEAELRAMDQAKGVVVDVYNEYGTASQALIQCADGQTRLFCANPHSPLDSLRWPLTNSSGPCLIATKVP